MRALVAYPAATTYPKVPEVNDIDRIVFAKRLNDFVSEDQKIEIDCFDFVTKFPYQPKIELIGA